MLTLEWRSGKRRVLPWAQMIDATFEDGELLLSFTGREVTLNGVNLAGLLEAVRECRLEKVWELPAGHKPAADSTRPCVSKIEVRDSDFYATLPDPEIPSRGQHITGGRNLTRNPSANGVNRICYDAETD